MNDTVYQEILTCNKMDIQKFREFCQKLIAETEERINHGIKIVEKLKKVDNA